MEAHFCSGKDSDGVGVGVLVLPLSPPVPVPVSIRVMSIWKGWVAGVAGTPLQLAKPLDELVLAELVHGLRLLELLEEHSFSSSFFANASLQSLSLWCTSSSQSLRSLYSAVSIEGSLPQCRGRP